MSAHDPSRLDEFLGLNHMPQRGGQLSLDAYWESLTWDEREECGIGRSELAERFARFLSMASEADEPARILSVDVLRGVDKCGEPERFDLRFVPGDVVCLVGPTGAGKSRFLADVECLAQGDTPTRRQVLINGRPPDPARRFSGEGGLVAQISQNMNFVMDLPVEEFLHMHAESRSLADPEAVVGRVMESAVGMAGEPFGPRTQITQLSGGQARALMIADAAFLSPKPIVLIDEIENAGVDRTGALNLFIEKGKIVLLSTHDPLLALSGGRRLVIRNGGVHAVLHPTADEMAARSRLVEVDAVMSSIRTRLRNGQAITLEDTGFLPCPDPAATPA